MKKTASSGFTLIELLVTITIIAILTAMGIVIYNDLQKGVRDAKRRSDVIAIAKAMEANATASGTYQALQSSWFVAGTYPVDPNCIPDPLGPNNPTGPTCPSDTGCGGATCRYCARQTVNTPAPCNNSGGPGSVIVKPGWPPGASLWVVCANLEGGGYFCKGNQR